MPSSNGLNALESSGLTGRVPVTAALCGAFHKRSLIALLGIGGGATIG